MDTDLARTLLTVITSGNFISAADRLHVNQSTVSTRIHTLEDQLGCTLFVRDKAGTTLTSAGLQFQRLPPHSFERQNRQPYRNS
jgi:LysR family transcriptional regulator, flagellar master operon regulator